MASGQSREVLALESSSSPGTKKNGLYVSRKAGVVLGIFFLSATVATGLLAYNLAPQTSQAVTHHQQQQQVLPQTSQTETQLQQQQILPPTSQTETHHQEQQKTGPAFITAVMQAYHTIDAGPQEKAVDNIRPPSVRPIHHQKPVLPKSPTKDSEKEVVDIRLPKTLRPVHYEVKLRPFILGNFSIFGSVDVEIEVLEATDNITLHILDIITKNETITVTAAEDGSTVAINQHLYDHERQFYIAKLESELMKGATYNLYMEFEGYMSDNLAGFYRSSYTNAEGNERFLAVTQFEATDARRAFPCFDEPELKATFEIYIAREESVSSIANMPLNETISFDGETGWVWDRFQKTLPVSTYLVAFVVSDFMHVDSNTNDHVLFRVWAREEAMSQTTYALDCGPQVLTFYEEYFNIPFPLPKQDMIAIPDFSAGAMENWGLITYRETALLYDENLSSASNKERVVRVIAHELAHQWFGNLVTMKWWNDLWLNEGFASYVELIGTDQNQPTWRIKDKFVCEDLQYVLELDSLESSHPISVNVNNPSEINQIFDDISYSKGSSILRMTNSYLTEETFRKGLTDYLTTLAYSNAEQDDLWRYLTAAAHTDGTLDADITVKMIMDTWTLQMGYPVITVNRNLDGTQATVTQERFLSVKNESADTSDYRWWVPLTYTSQDNPDFENTQPQLWMTDNEAEVAISSLPTNDQWVIFNIQETGYYRVNYDTNNWNLLVQQLNTNHTAIHDVNRAQIIDDAMDLARAGGLNYTTALSVNSYLGSEVEYIPWYTALRNFGYMEGMFSRKGGYGSLKKYLLSLLVPLYNSVGFDDPKDDPQLEHYKRSLATSWVCDLGHQDCVDKSVALYQDWMINPETTSISPNQKSTVYCTGIAAGGEDEWNFAWNQYLTANLAQEKDTLLSALACSKEIWILSRYLEMSFTADSGIRRQDASGVFADVSKNDVGRDLAWNFLRDEWEMISNYFGSFTTLGDLVLVVSQEFNTQQEYHQLELFKEEHATELGTATAAVDQALEKTSINIAWMDNYYDLILQWLNDNGFKKRQH